MKGPFSVNAAIQIFERCNSLDSGVMQSDVATQYKGLAMTFIEMQTVDMNWYRIFHTSKWRATFLEAAGNAARLVSEYSRNRGEYENAARWKRREIFIREYVERVRDREDE